jgi:drug/metabolite transporter (DMT)-like permease
LPVFRFGVAGLALLPWLGGLKQIRQILRADLGLLLAAALLAVPVNQGFFLSGTRLAPTTHVGLIYASCPLVVLGLALLLRQERLEPARMLGIAASVAGALVIAYGSLLQRGSGAAGAATLTGDLLLVGAVTSWGGYVTVNKRLVSRHPSIAVLGLTFLLGAMMALPVALWTAPRWVPELAGTRPQAWAGLLYLTLVASVLGLACQNLALRRLDASHLATVGNLSPVLTVLWGVWLLGEAMTPSLAVGGALSLAGVAVAGRALGTRPRRIDRPGVPVAGRPLHEAPSGAPAA